MTETTAEHTPTEQKVNWSELFIDLLLHPLDVPHSVPELVLAPGAALFVAGFVYSRWRMFGAPTVFRSVATLLCLVAAAAAPLLPLVATAALVTVILAGLNVAEYAWITSGRRVLLFQRRASTS